MPRGVPFDYLNLSAPNADVLAADQWVRAHGVSSDGAIRLMKGFWDKIRADLEHGLPGTRDWLDSVAYREWCAVLGVAPDDLRDHLISAHWRYRAA
jgi:hypothetical protein